ncbi:MAG: hypothetical protein AB7I30_21315 [Isosphaeraceae bacterium]
MSGPIVRKYGFPNFDAIFGKKELQHGTEEPEAAKEQADADPKAASPKDEPQSSAKKG